MCSHFKIKCEPMDNEKTKLNVPSQSAYIYLHVLSTGISHYVPLCVFVMFVQCMCACAWRCICAYRSLFGTQSIWYISIVFWTYIGTHYLNTRKKYLIYFWNCDVLSNVSVLMSVCLRIRGCVSAHVRMYLCILSNHMGSMKTLHKKKN